MNKEKNTPGSSHLDAEGNAIMVNIKEKDETERFAKASCTVLLNKEAFNVLKSGTSKKGDILSTARVAGIIATKKTHELIPLCHNLRISSVKIDFQLIDSKYSCIINSEIEGIDRTGFEMESLTAVTVAGLTIYDMLKSVDRGIALRDIHLVEKWGGKSGHYTKQD